MSYMTACRHVCYIASCKVVGLLENPRKHAPHSWCFLQLQPDELVALSVLK